jgi:hypothetical protein
VPGCCGWTFDGQCQNGNLSPGGIGIPEVRLPIFS